MEFQEGMMKFVVHKPIQTKWAFERDTEKQRTTEAATPRRKWKIFNKSLPSSPSKPLNPKPKQPPKEFLCPISGSLMADPVIVSSGHTFEQACVKACKALAFTPILSDSSTSDFSSIIPNLALKSTILNWCKNSSVEPPKPIDSNTAEKLVRTLMAAETQKSGTKNENEAQQTEISEKKLIQGVREKPSVNSNHHSHCDSSSDDSFGTNASTRSLQLVTQPSCYSSPSSSEIETLTPNSTEEGEILAKLKSQQVFEIEEAVILLRQITRTREDSRANLCTPRLISALRSLIISRYSSIQVNSVAALVNLSLEKANKVRIVRSGIVPPLIDVLKGGFPEAQEHASGALFSLALDDNNKTAIGVLGALQPLIHMLRSDSERTRHDSALALYHLSLVQSNRSKLVKLGSIPILLGMLRSGHMTGRVLLILCNLAWCMDGRAAMLDAGGVGCLVGLLDGAELKSESAWASCVDALYGLSHGGLRFKGLAKVVGAEEALMKVEKAGSKRAWEKAKRVLEMIKRKEEEEEVDWVELLELGSQTLC
ncbi:U-box domain-containing protein 40 [Alnus glutinosa]|uniref:U-box domain-containing protein 40 n=1 Tax=Alnus glutinosa TaxID=3517 RepID=UPI002D765B1F|nr:U-box domain-containing protein 40 [Alnus glutinosa]